MAERIAVDHEALRGAGRQVDGFAGGLERQRVALSGVLVGLEDALAGAVSVGALRELGEAVEGVHGDLVTALGGLGQGLESVVDRFVEVDVVSADAARAAW